MPKQKTGPESFESVVRSRMSLKKYRSCKGSTWDAFSCSLYFDGKYVCDVSDSGEGGCPLYKWKYIEDEKQIYAWTDTLPDKIYEGKTFKPSLDSAIYLLVDDLEVERQFRKWCRTKTVLQFPDTPEDTAHVINLPFNEDVQAYIERVYPDAEIINLHFQKDKKGGVRRNL